MMGGLITIAGLVVEAHTNAVEKGFWEKSQNIGEKLSLIHSEVSEALEELRSPSGPNNTDKPYGFGSELADIVIRVADLAGYLGIDLEKEVIRKCAYNKTRPRLHGKKF